MTDQRRAGWLRRRVRSSARLTGLARGVRLFVQGPPKSSSSAARPPASPTWDRIPELRTVEFRASSIGGDRLNLIVPTVQPAGVFGGVRTALDLFTALAEGAPKARIISLGPTPDPAEAGLPGYVRTGPADDSDIARSIVSLGDPATELAVGPGDVFVATYWTTAELTQRIRAWQATAFGGPGSPMVYLIQDYEPGFYPWSAQFLLARGTYADPSATLAIFNSKLLQDYLHGQGLSFRREFVFEPRLAEPLRRYLPAQRVARPRRILVYGSTEDAAQRVSAHRRRPAGLGGDRPRGPRMVGRLNRPEPPRHRPGRRPRPFVAGQAEHGRIRRAAQRIRDRGLAHGLRPTQAIHPSRWPISGCSS